LARSAGFSCLFTAARRHAGGIATTIFARARKAKIMVDLAANMLDGQNELLATVGVKGVSRVKMKQLLRSQVSRETEGEKTCEMCPTNK